MVLDPSANFVRQSLRKKVDTNDPETIDVSDASAFPDPANGQYNLVLWDTAAGRPDQDLNAEIVRVTGRDTGADTLTVARAQEGTSNEKHPNTSAMQLAHTAKLRDDTDSAVGSVGSFSGTPPTIDEVTAAVNNDSVQTEELNNAVVLLPGDSDTELQDKLNSVDADTSDDGPVIVGGKITGISTTLTANNIASLWGNGWIAGNGTTYGSTLEGSVANGPLIELKANNQIDGIAVKNNDPDGDAVRAEEYTTIESASLWADRYVVDIVQANSGGAEPFVRNSKLFSDAGAAGSVGIRNPNEVSDASYENLIIRGMETAIVDTAPGPRIEGVHCYPTPGSMARGVEVRVNSRITDCYVDNVTDECVTVTGNAAHHITDNKLIPADGADGVHFDFSSSLGILNSRVKDNRFDVASGTGGTAVRGTNVSGAVQTDIRDNSIQNYSSDGIKTVASGQASIGSGSTSTTVNHGLPDKPEPTDISIYPTAAWVDSGNAAAKFEIDRANTDDTSFTIKLDADPTQTCVFAWKAELT